MGMYDRIVGTRLPGGERLGNAEIWERIIGQTEQHGRGVMDMNSAFDGLNTADDVSRVFNLNGAGIESKYNPARRNLNTALSRSRSAQASRMGAGTAIPEAGFGDIEGRYAGAFGDLESSAANEKLNMDRFVAQILQGAKRGQDVFSLAKNQMYGNLLGDRARYSDAYMNRGDIDREMDGNWLQDIGAGMDILGNVLGFPTGKGKNLGDRIFG